MSKQRKLTSREYVRAIVGVAKETYRAAPLASIIQIIGALITSILPLVTTFFAALTTTALADAYMGKPDAGQQAITLVVLTALVGVVQMAWSSFERYMSELMRYRVEAAISDRMYEHFLNLDFWRYDDKDTADMYDRARDFGRFFPYVFNQISGLIVNAITVVISIIALFFISWWISVIILIAIIPGIYFQLKLSRAQIAHRNAHVTTRRSKGILEWILGDYRQTAELRLYGLVKHLLKMRNNLREQDEKARIDFERQYIGKQLAADMLEQIAQVIALVVIVFEIIARQQPVGYFLLVQQIVQRVLGDTNSFVRTLGNLDEDLANLVDYQEFMRLPEREGGSQQLRKIPDLIEMKDIQFHYHSSEAKVLDGVSISIAKGQHVAIVGENGAGKSTLIKILTGLYEPIGGEVLLDGNSLENIRISDWHRKLAVLRQDVSGHSFVNAKDSILLGDISRPYSEERYEKALKMAEAKSFLSKLPKGDQTFTNLWMEDEDGVKGVDLSGGQWQRLALARNFYRDSPIIILDEPTSAIDALAESRIFKRLLNDKEKTIITISHRLTTVEKADYIYMLEDGRVVEEGTHDDLVKRKKAYFTMFESQLGDR